MLRVNAQYRDVDYEFLLRHKVSLILGLSGTGKSTLLDALGSDSAFDIKINSLVNSVTLSEGVDLTLLKGGIREAEEGSLIVIDELPRNFLAEASDLINKKTCWFLIINRSPPSNVHISVDAVYRMVLNGGKNVLENIFVQENVEINKGVVCEGNGGELEFYKNLFLKDYKYV